MIQYRGGDGSIKEKAVVVRDAYRDYLDKKYGTWDLEDQTFLEDSERQYDIMNITYHLGQKRKQVWFDGSDFDGKD